MSAANEKTPTVSAVEALDETPSTTKENHVNIMTLQAKQPDGQQKTMTSREIAELTGKDLAHVHRDIREMLDALKKDDPKLDHPKEDKDARGYTTCFYLNRELTDTLLTGYNVVARNRVIKRWHELESQVAAPVFDPASMTRIDILKLAMESEEGRLKEKSRADHLEEVVLDLQPKANALALISATTGTRTTTEAAKELGMKRKDLTTWMHANGWIYRQNGSWLAYDRFIKNGCLQYKEGTYTDDSTGQECKKPYCHITAKGLTRLAQQLARMAA